MPSHTAMTIFLFFIRTPKQLYHAYPTYFGGPSLATITSISSTLVMPAKLSTVLFCVNSRRAINFIEAPATLNLRVTFQ